MLTYEEIRRWRRLRSFLKLLLVANAVLVILWARLLQRGPLLIGLVTCSVTLLALIWGWWVDRNYCRGARAVRSPRI